jgi:hypothetical protein
MRRLVQNTSVRFLRQYSNKRVESCALYSRCSQRAFRTPRLFVLSSFPQWAPARLGPPAPVGIPVTCTITHAALNAWFLAWWHVTCALPCPIHEYNSKLNAWLRPGDIQHGPSWPSLYNTQSPVGCMRGRARSGTLLRWTSLRWEHRRHLGCIGAKHNARRLYVSPQGHGCYSRQYLLAVVTGFAAAAGVLPRGGERQVRASPLGFIWAGAQGWVERACGRVSGVGIRRSRLWIDITVLVTPRHDGLRVELHALRAACSVDISCTFCSCVLLFLSS